MPSFSSLFTATAASLLALSTGVSALRINSPASLTQCVPVQLAWGDGEAPFFPSVVPGGDPSAGALKQWPSTEDTTLTWIVDLPEGTSVTLAITDSTGATAYSSEVTINAGSDDSCLNESSTDRPTGSAVRDGDAPDSTASTTGASTTRSSSTEATSTPGRGTTTVTSQTQTQTSSQTAVQGAVSSPPANGVSPLNVDALTVAATLLLSAALLR